MVMGCCSLYAFSIIDYMSVVIIINEKNWEIKSKLQFDIC